MAGPHLYTVLWLHMGLRKSPTLIVPLYRCSTLLPSRRSSHYGMHLMETVYEEGFN